MKKFDNFNSNLSVLLMADQQDLNNTFVTSGIIDKFYIQFELAWKVLKELLMYEGRVEANSGSPRQIIKTAYEVWDFMDEEIWLDMLADRNLVTHLYDEKAAMTLVDHILNRYIPEFCQLQSFVSEQYPEL